MCELDNGRLMARFCAAFDTMKLFHHITGRESMEELVSWIFHTLNVIGFGKLTKLLMKISTPHVSHSVFDA